MSASEFERTYSQGETARILGISVKTLIVRRQRGEIGHYDHGSLKRYSASHIREYLESKEKPAVAAAGR